MAKTTNARVALDLSQKQMDFVTAVQHYLGFIGGIGSGKTYGGSIRALMAGGGQIGNQRIKTPNLGVITAPTYPMLRDATLRTFFEVAGDAIADYNKSENLVRLINGSEILFRSTEHYERLRGPSASWWFGDEAALYHQNVWKIMVGRLRQFGQHGYAWITTSPKGRNWIWSRFIRDNQFNPKYALIKAATRDNVHLSLDFIEGLYNEYSGDFALQELEGEFIAFEGLIYAEFQRDIHMTQATIDLSRFKRITAGVDWGFNNPGVILIAGEDEDGRAWIIHEEYQRRRRIEEWVEVAKQLRQDYPVESWYCDPSKPEYIKLFTDAGLEAQGADNKVELGLQKVRQRLVVQKDRKPRLILASSAANAATEFEQYQWAKHRDGLKDVPLKANDHAMDALRYLVMGLEADEGGGTITISTSRFA